MTIGGRCSNRAHAAEINPDCGSCSSVSRICSGWKRGVGSQSNARSTTCRIWLNHQFGAVQPPFALHGARATVRSRQAQFELFLI